MNKQLISEAQNELRAYNEVIRNLNRADGGKRALADLSIPEKIAAGEKAPSVPIYTLPGTPDYSFGKFADFSESAIREQDALILRSADSAKMKKLIGHMKDQDYALIESRYDFEIAMRQRRIDDDAFNFLLDVGINQNEMTRRFANFHMSWETGEVTEEEEEAVEEKKTKKQIAAEKKAIKAAEKAKKAEEKKAKNTKEEKVPDLLTLKDLTVDASVLRAEMAALAENKRIARTQEKKDNDRYFAALGKKVSPSVSEKYERLCDKLKEALDRRAMINETLFYFYDSQASKDAYSGAKKAAYVRARNDIKFLLELPLPVSTRTNVMLLFDQKINAFAKMEEARALLSNTKFCGTVAAEAVRRDLYLLEGNVRQITEELNEWEAIARGEKKRTDLERDYTMADSLLSDYSVSYRASFIVSAEKKRAALTLGIEDTVREICYLTGDKSLLPDVNAKTPFGERKNDYPAKV